MRQESPSFVRRDYADGSWHFICMVCYRTVHNAQTEDELEAAHHCKGPLQDPNAR